MLHRFAVLATTILLATSCGTSQHTAPAASDSNVTQEGADALADVYAERLRLGLGSPYRLIDAAMHDERLGDTRVVVARDLLAQIDDGEIYELSPLVFVAAGVPAANAAAHLDLIRTAVESSQDPRVGELAVAIAYAGAATDSVVTPYVADRAARVAALVRDRELAISDAYRLREAAGRMAVAPEHLTLTWRRELRFAVEQPTLAPLDRASEEDAARLATLLSGGVRAAAAPVTGLMRRTAGDLQRAPAIDTDSFTRDTVARPAQSALVITLRAIRASSHDPALRVSEVNWQSFFERVRDEETFIVELAAARIHEADDVVAAGITLDAAIALRPFAQERVGGVPAISVQEMRTRYGLQVKFGDAVTTGERARFMGMLANALADMRSVARTLDLQGLTFKVAPIAPNTRHLAFHDPVRRVIHIDPSAAAGTIAHEIGHDLDWQLSKRKYNTKSNYATDYAARNGRVLAYAVNNLVAERALMGDPAAADAPAERPAEVFARRFEWYVASALALKGRSNGYLSPVQNDWITGYSSAIRPDASASAAGAFADLLSEATRMTRQERASVIRVVVESTPSALSCAPARSPFAPAWTSYFTQRRPPGTSLASKPKHDRCDCDRSRCGRTDCCA